MLKGQIRDYFHVHYFYGQTLQPQNGKGECDGVVRKQMQKYLLHLTFVSKFAFIDHNKTMATSNSHPSPLQLFEGSHTNL